MSQASLDLSKYVDRESGDCPVFLMDITHPQLKGVLRLCTVAVERISPWEDGQPRYGLFTTLGKAGGPKYEYIYCPMSLSPPSQEEEGAPRANFTTGRTAELVRALRSITTAADVTLRLVFSGSPNVVEEEYPALKLSGTEFGQATISGTLGMDLQDGEPFPGMTYSRRWFGGIH